MANINIRILKVLLKIIDVNDNAPEFPVPSVYNINISEATPIESQYSLDIIKATDRDIGIYGCLSLHQFSSTRFI